MANISGEESIVGAPSSESDKGDDSDSESVLDSLTEWLIFGHEDCLDQRPEVTDESTITETATAFEGLHWETGTEITAPPPTKKDSMPTKIKEGFLHLFSTSINSMFAVFPYGFWELMVFEINRYAQQFMTSKNTCYVLAKLWTAVTVSEILIYFAILIQSMLYPETGR